MIGYFNLVNNLNNYVNYYFIIIIVPEKPLRGGSIKYVCMYTDNNSDLNHLYNKQYFIFERVVSIVLRSYLVGLQAHFQWISSKRHLHQKHQHLKCTYMKS